MQLKVLGAAALAIALAACHHHDDSGTTTTTTPTSTDDAYTTAISGVVNGPDAASETAAPVAVSGTTPSTSDTSQPVPVNAN
jgi:hypothetical protein